MQRKLILSCLLITSCLLTNQTKINYEIKKEVDFRNYKLEEIDEIAKRRYEELKEQREKELEIQKQKEEELRKEREKNRIYCKFEISFYTTAADEGSGTGLGASGEYVVPWVSIALPSDIPFYSEVYIEGLGEFINHDRGSYIQWTYDEEGNLVCRADILVESKTVAYEFGRYYSEGYIDIKN